MYFKNLELKNFRNYDSIRLKFDPGVNIFVGNNGQGKTNLVEALYLLVRGHSFRPGVADVWLKKTAQETCPAAMLKAEVDREGLNSEISLQFTPTQKFFFLDNKRTHGIDLEAKFPSVLFSPESLMAIKEGPEQRRQLIDEVVVSHGEGRWVRDFKRALKSRNRLLKDYRQGLYSETQVTELLDAMDGVYVPIAAALTHARLRLLLALEPDLKDALKFIGPKDLVDISVDYLISDKSARAWDLREVLEAISNRLKSLRKSEMLNGTTLVGPHKHEIRFISAGNDARYFCSQGQQRALILGFKMAQIMYYYRAFKVQPLLLLDDVLSELDPVKGANLLSFMESIRSQIILTTTDIAFPFDFGAKGLSVFRMNMGQVESLRV